jgi:hypothetical protein
MNESMKYALNRKSVQNLKLLAQSKCNFMPCQWWSKCERYAALQGIEQFVDLSGYSGPLIRSRHACCSAESFQRGHEVEHQSHIVDK